MPVLTGQKSDTERFAGALRTYSIEAMMQDKKALQAGTSHNLGQNFARAFDTYFQGRDGKQHHVWQTSWGVSTRLIGGLVMTHSDDSGLVVPPKLAAHHVVFIVIGKSPEERAAVLAKTHALADEMKRAGLSVLVDDDETKGPGFKYFEYELMGVCLRVELGPKDLAKDQCVMVRRDNRQKEFVPLAQALPKAQAMLEAMQRELFAKAKDFRAAHTFEVGSMDELKAKADDGFLMAHWCGDAACEASVKEQTGGVTTRNRPFDLQQVPGKCLVCAKPAPGQMVFSKAY
jgi:prolyl-tRNA synthetase